MTQVTSRGSASFEGHLEALLNDALRGCPTATCLVLADSQGLPIWRVGSSDIHALTGAAMAGVAHATGDMIFKSFALGPAHLVEIRNTGWKVLAHRRQKGGLTILTIAPATADSSQLEQALRAGLAAAEEALLGMR